MSGAAKSALAERIAEQLAIETMEVVDASKDDAVIRRVQQTLADQSQTLEEAFTVAVRVLMAEKRARAVLARGRAEAGLG